MAGIEVSRIFVDEESGTTIERPGLRAALGYAREGDVLVVPALDRLGRTVRETSNLIHDLAQRGVKNLVAPDKIACAVHLREQGEMVAQIVAKTGVPRTSLHHCTPPRPAEPLTADGSEPAGARL